MATNIEQIFGQYARKKSTALQPFLWLATILSSAIIGAAKWGVPVEVIYVEVVLLAATVWGFLKAYFFLLKVDRDALRSEPYQLAKYAMDRGLIGDNNSGAVDPNDVDNIPSQPSDKEGP